MTSTSNTKPQHDGKGKQFQSSNWHFIFLPPSLPHLAHLDKIKTRKNCSKASTKWNGKYEGREKHGKDVFSVPENRRDEGGEALCKNSSGGGDTIFLNYIVYTFPGVEKSRLGGGEVVMRQVIGRWSGPQGGGEIVVMRLMKIPGLYLVLSARELARQDIGKMREGGNCVWFH